MKKVWVIFFLISQSLLSANINLHFIVDENYLITHTLTGCSWFSSDQYKDSIIAFQNEAWEKNEIGYRLLPNHNFLTPELCLHISLKEFISFAKSLETFQPILSQTLSYKNTCEKLWRETYDITSQYITNVTGLKLDGTFEVHLTHPSLHNGEYLGNHQICWGCSGAFEYYDVIYLWHEILHAYLPEDDISHCLIQLITDNGVRLLLNEREQPFPLISHKELLPLMEEIYPQWEDYLKKPDHNIFQFLNELKETISRS